MQDILQQHPTFSSPCVFQSQTEMVFTNMITGSMMENVEMNETWHCNYTVSDDPLLYICFFTCLNLICIDTWQGHLAGSDDPSAYGRQRPAVVVAATAESNSRVSSSSSSSNSNSKSPAIIAITAAPAAVVQAAVTSEAEQQ